MRQWKSYVGSVLGVITVSLLLGACSGDADSKTDQSSGQATIGQQTKGEQTNPNQGPETPPVPVPTPGPTPVPTPEPTPSPSPTATATPPPVTALVVVQSTQGPLGVYLSDTQGRSLYLFLADTANVSNCSGACAQVWPPLTVPSGQAISAGGDAQTALLGTITREGGQTQVTYKGQPLYYFGGDVSPGQTTGEGLNSFGAAWFLVKPDGSSL